MRHKITQISESENERKYKISIKIPFNLGWIERVRFNIKTFDKTNAYPMEHIKNTDGYAFFETTITLKTCAIYHYYFSFEADCRFQYYKKENITGDNSVTDEECWKMSVGFDVPDWAKGAMMYHVFVDRYRRSEELKKEPMPRRKIHKDWNESPVIGPNENGDWNVDFHCGDLKGISKTIKCIKKLGVDIIYLSPVVRSQSTHRYDASDYMNVDPYAGTNELLKELCEKAHKKGIKVILDAVFNHTGSDSIYFNQYGTFNSIGAYQVEYDENYKGMKSPYSDFYKKYCHYGEHGFEYWWGMTNLPVCDGNSKHWIDFICGVGGVIDTWFKLGIDGLRLDVADELTDNFIEKIHMAVKRNKSDGFILGEVWKNPMRMGRGYISSAKGMHSVMNYLLVDALIRYYKYSDTWKLVGVLKEIFAEYPTETIQTLMNFTSTHDMSRPIEVFGCNDFQQYGEWAWNLINDSPEWVRNHKITRDEYKYGKMTYKSYCFALAFLPGIFSTFYGDEVGTKGIGNLANRAPYPWGHRDKDLLKFFRMLGKIRKEQVFLRTAEFRVIKITEQQFVFERYNKNEKMIVVVSRTHNITNVMLPDKYKNAKVVFGLKGCTKEQLKPYGAIALKNE